MGSDQSWIELIDAKDDWCTGRFKDVVPTCARMHLTLTSLQRFRTFRPLDMISIHCCSSLSPQAKRFFVSFIACVSSWLTTDLHTGNLRENAMNSVFACVLLIIQEAIKVNLFQSFFPCDDHAIAIRLICSITVVATAQFDRSRILFGGYTSTICKYSSWICQLAKT